MTNYYIEKIMPDLIKVLEKGTENANGPQQKFMPAAGDE
jgi:hypothetical protein